MIMLAWLHFYQIYQISRGSRLETKVASEDGLSEGATKETNAGLAPIEAPARGRHYGSETRAAPLPAITYLWRKIKKALSFVRK